VILECKVGLAQVVLCNISVGTNPYNAGVTQFMNRNCNVINEELFTKDSNQEFREMYF